MVVEIESNNFNNSRYGAMLHRSGQCGRPAYDISEEQLLFLLERAFNIRDFSSILGVSVRTVERRMSSFGLSVTGKLMMKKFVNFRKCDLEINIIKIKN